jgi:GNAT superfamily N-acetyltransferase
MSEQRATGRPAPKLGQGVLQFLGSLGQRSEAELYLRIFQALPPEEFALLIPSVPVLRERSGTLAEQIRFLRDLDLSPIVVLDALDARNDGAAAHFYSALIEAGLEAVELCIDSGTVLEKENLRVGLLENQVLVVRLSSGEDKRLVELASVLCPHKTLFLRDEGGLGPHQTQAIEVSPGHVLQMTPSGIATINLRSDAEELVRSRLLSQEDSLLFERARKILEGPTGERARATVSVASPLAILRELFTVTGEGTLIKRGAAIIAHEGWSGVDVRRVRELLEIAFARSAKSEFFERVPLQVHLEEEYRGMALVEAGEHASFLSKFAVLPVARGEGLGQDLWWSLSKVTPALYWRSRAENPINGWYKNVCDGMHRAGRWIVFWRGVEPALVPDLVADAVRRPEDFAS